MASDTDGLLVQTGCEQVAQMAAHPRGAQRQTQLLVEVAVGQPALPVHADRAAAHHASQVLWLEAAFQQIDVAVKAAFGHQRRAKTLDRHVGQRKQVVEHDTEVLEQLALVVGLQGLLIRRQ